MSLTIMFAFIVVSSFVMAKVGYNVHARCFFVRARTLPCCLNDNLTSTYLHNDSQLSMPDERATDRLGAPKPHRSRPLPLSGETRIDRYRPFLWAGHSWCHRSALFATTQNVRFDARSHCFRTWKQQQLESRRGRNPIKALRCQHKP